MGEFIVWFHSRPTIPRLPPVPDDEDDDAEGCLGQQNFPDSLSLVTAKGTSNVHACTTRRTAWGGKDISTAAAS